MNSETGEAGPSAIVLAAGKGTRMNADLPKVCLPVGGRPMVTAVVDACLEAGCTSIVTVVGYKHEAVREALADLGDRVSFAMQDEQLGTGHAVMCAADRYRDIGTNHNVFVLCGDGPLIRAETLRVLLARHRETGAAATLATSVLDDPSGYGRVVRDAGGRFADIVEQKNAWPEQLEIREVNPSYYCFRADRLFDALTRVERNDLSGEYYVTDVPKLLLDAGDRVEIIEAVPPEDVLSINTPEQLAEVDRVFRERNAAGAVGSES